MEKNKSNRKAPMNVAFYVRRVAVDVRSHGEICT